MSKENISIQMANLLSLKEKGHISDTEFTRHKALIIGESASQPPPIIQVAQTPPPIIRVVQTPKAKSRGVYIILGFFLGVLGVHNFYAGYYGSAIFELIITFVFGWLIFPLIIIGLIVLLELIFTTKDGSGRKFG